jgi:trimethylamine--corrinoid protein Co-methyltransferase
VRTAGKLAPFKILDDEAVSRVVDEALGLLRNPGVQVPNDEVASLLQDAGGRAEGSSRIVSIPSELVETALRSAPSHFSLYNADGVECVTYGSGAVHFNPGSAAVRLLEPDGRSYREPRVPDLVRLAVLVGELDEMDAQSTALVPGDVPRQIADRYRLYIALKYCRKPVVTGAFVAEGVPAMMRLLAACAGGEDAVRSRPRAVFDCCPSPPLMWSQATCQNLIDCAKLGLPAELVSMPLAGATGPATLFGSVIQHTAETLSGVVIHQLSGPGAPIVYGGSPSIFEMRQGTTPMGAVETLMLDCALSQIGRHLGLPTHAYMGLSDSKALDVQAGLEAAMGTLLGALSGISMISGAGMLEFESCQSLEKLVIDNDVCAMARRLISSIDTTDGEAASIIREVGPAGHFLAHKHTLKWFQREQRRPSPVIDRLPRSRWEEAGRTSALEKASSRVRELLSGEIQPVVSSEVGKELAEVIMAEARGAGMPSLLLEKQERHS